MSVSLCVIAPSYNHANYIEACLSSILNYEPGDFTVNLIVIDDYSQDGTAEVAETFLKTNTAASKLKSYSIIRNEFNHGAHANYNRAINLCNSDIIHFMNTDDAIEQNRFKEVVNAYQKISNKEQKDTFWGFGTVELIDENGHIFCGDGFWQYLTHILKYISPNLPSISFHLLWDNLAISTGNIFVSTNFARKLGGLNNYLYVHDWDFILRCLLFSEPFILREPKTQYLYRHHPGNTFKKLNYIGGYESYEVLYRHFRNVVLGHPKNKNTLSISNYEEDILLAWLAQSAAHENIAKNIIK